MSENSRWVRVNVDWMDSDWLYVLSAESRLAWVALICRAKSHGQGGRLKKTCPEILARLWLIGEESVRQMLKAAEQAGALRHDGDEWSLTKWAKYQTDPTAAERKQRQRERQKSATQVQTVTHVTRDNRAVTDVTDVTLTEQNITEQELTPSISPSRGTTAKFVKPTDQECREYAERLGMPPDEGSHYFDYWESAGWRRRAGPVKDWKAGLRTWKANYLERPGNGRKQGFGEQYSEVRRILESNP